MVWMETKDGATHRTQLTERELRRWLEEQVEVHNQKYWQRLIDLPVMFVVQRRSDNKLLIYWKE